MGRIRFDTATTIDGYIADAHDSLSWLFAVPGSDDAERDIATPESVVDVMGSTTYEWMLREMDFIAHPEKWTEFFATKTVFVFTSRELPTPVGADVRFLRGSVADNLSAIRDAAGDGDIWVVGGGDLAGQFLDADALDELAVSIAPVTLGTGAPLFPRRLESDRLHLTEAQRVGQFVRAVYEVRPASA